MSNPGWSRDRSCMLAILSCWLTTVATRIQKRHRLVVFLSLGHSHERHDPEVLLHGLLDLAESDTEEFTPWIGHVHPTSLEALMKRVLQSRSVLAVDHCVHVEVKRHRGVAELVHALERLKSTCHPDFVDVFPERSDVGQNVNVPGSG